MIYLEAIVPAVINDSSAEPPAESGDE